MQQEQQEESQVLPARKQPLVFVDEDDEDDDVDDDVTDGVDEDDHTGQDDVTEVDLAEQDRDDDDPFPPDHDDSDVEEQTVREEDQGNVEHSDDSSSGNEQGEASCAAASAASGQEEFADGGCLRTAWVFYAELSKDASSKVGGGGYAKSKDPILRIETVADFWGVFNNVSPPSSMSMNSMYQLFRDGVQPEWEDPTNANGFSFEFGVDAKAGDKLWIEFAMGAVGENLPFSDEIVGVFVKLREKGPRVGIWLTSTTETRVREIMQLLGQSVPEANIRPLMVYEHAAELEKFKGGSSANDGHAHGAGRGGPSRRGALPGGRGASVTPHMDSINPRRAPRPTTVPASFSSAVVAEERESDGFSHKPRHPGGRGGHRGGKIARR